MKIRYIPKLNTYEKLLLYFMVVVVLLNAATSLLNGIVSYGTYFALTALIFYTFIKVKICTRKKWLLFVFLFFISGVLSSVYGDILMGGILNDIHRHLFFTISLFLVFCVKWNNYLGKDFVYVFMKAILFLGIVASVFAMVSQGDSIPLIILTGDRVYYEEYKSFFTQRNVYAAFLFFCSISTVYMYGRTKKKLYVFYLIIFVFQIYLASSKASLAGTLVFIALYMYMVTKKRIFFVLIALIIAVPIANDVIFPIFTGLTHASLEGVTTGEVRLSDWTLGFNKLNEEKAFITGLGMGSEATYLTRFRQYGSFHNVYIDLLFQGGIIKVFIYVYAMVEILKRILVSQNENFKNTFFAAFIAYAAYSMFESGAMLFSISFFSFLTTVMFGILPQCELGDANRRIK